MLVTAHMYLHGHVHQEHCCHGTLRLAVPLVGPKLCVRLQNLQQALLTSQTKSKIKKKIVLDLLLKNNLTELLKYLS